MLLTMLEYEAVNNAVAEYHGTRYDGRSPKKAKDARA